MNFTEYTIPIEHSFALFGSKRPNDEQYRIARPLVDKLVSKHGLIEIRARVQIDKVTQKPMLDMEVKGFPWVNPDNVNLEIVHNEVMEILGKLHEISGFWLRADETSMRAIENTFKEILATANKPVRKENSVNPQDLN